MRVFSRVSGAKASGLASVLGMAVLLSGCSAYDQATTMLDRGAASVFEGIAWVGGNAAMPWGGLRPGSPSDSLTVQRVRGTSAGTEPLLPEPGNVWPEREAPRATLMNPEQAMRGIPAYTPLVGDRPPAPVQPAEPAPRRGAGGPQVPPPASAQPEAPRPQSALPPLAPLPLAPARPAGGQAMQTPQGAVVPATAAGNAGSFATPGGAGGVITRDGNTTIISRPGEAPTTVMNPR